MKKQIRTLMILAGASLGLFSCGNDNGQETRLANVNLNTRAIAENAPPPGQRSIAGANFITSVVGVREVGIIEAGTAPNTRILFGEGSIRHLTPISSALPQTENFGTAPVPHGDYDRLTLRLDRGEQLPDGSGLRNRSLIITGNVNNMPLTIFTDNEEIITSVITGGPIGVVSDETLYLNIDYNILFQGINLSAASDGDGNGTVEIEPSNKDGNREIYNAMVQNLPNAFTVTRE
jgi:hypothetical protein